MFCSWASDASGLIGSYKLIEEYMTMLNHRAVAYLNVDTGLQGGSKFYLFHFASIKLILYLWFNLLDSDGWLVNGSPLLLQLLCDSSKNILELNYLETPIDDNSPNLPNNLFHRESTKFSNYIFFSSLKKLFMIWFFFLKEQLSILHLSSAPWAFPRSKWVLDQLKE